MIITNSDTRSVVALESEVEGRDGVLILFRPSVGFTVSLQLTIAEIARMLRHFDKRGKEETGEAK